ncbi:alpha/beta-hydrolase [Dothidotthia symphoricarpi CBS 119687]|uniref:Carboxylic ester hydrolase n=1 Tax=Dothidotthia symphoricarpi CBS 119687 TaxID=1392245 RepID=A0A6A6AJD8_9PLEO|nr:alpha/beta-hydrolase [Dothidotthia symphoricarpi CBS 119687]KAF2131920.1 alpha/beta-hydrolase [Dothidotthia symphoricarpi CBS 119687]
MYFTPILTLLTLTLTHASPFPFQNTTLPTVHLDYGTFRGASSETYNLTYYRRIPFAASTAGSNRFRAPQPPPRITNGTYDTDRAFDMCPQRTVNGSEDCLYLGLYSRPWDAATQDLRPVLLTFYGGGFIQGSASFTIPPSGYPVLDVDSAGRNDYVVVYANYRTNVFGFLPGAKVKEHREADLNTGLLDQRAALEWIQRYVHLFGGDGGDVTIWGQSAGGGSVVAQSIATGNKGRGLFRRAMSSSPFWPKTYRFDGVEAEGLYGQVVRDVGCEGVGDEIACLKSVDVQALRDSSLKLSTSQQYAASTFTWGPFIDDEFLAEPLSSVVRGGELNVDTVFATYNLHEGENFVPPGFQTATGSSGFNSSEASFDAWLEGFLPGFEKEDMEKVKELYPASGEAEEIHWNTTYVRAGLLYRDLVLACPAYWLADKAQNGWLSEYTISPAKHASDTIYWNQINAVQTSDPLTYQGYAGAMASFVQTGDPNAHKVTNSSIVGVPAVAEGKQFLVTAGGLRQGSISMLEQRCGFWLDVADKVPI